MQLRNVPFNVSILDPETDLFFGMTPVSSLAMFDTQTGDFADDGLFSNTIFGRQGEKERQDNFSFIDLKTRVFHPLYFEELTSLKKLYGGIIMGTSYAKWDAKLKDFVPAKILDGESGMSFFLKHFYEIKFKRNKSSKRSIKIDFIERFKDQCLMRRHIVIPAALRDVEFDDGGRPVEDDLNPLYKRLISNANTLSPAITDENDTGLDRPRASIQIAVNNVYKHIFNLLKGKRGFMMAKVASRKVAGTTRNVISSMEVGTSVLGDPRQPTVDTVVVGMPQFLAGMRYKMKYQINSGAYSEFFSSEGVGTELIDKETLELTPVKLSPRSIDKWLTSDGMDKTIAGFSEPKSRHKPIIIDGHYLGLVYQDEKSYKLFRDINDLPEGFDRANVRPITYAEFFYAHAAPLVDKAYGFATRYPVTGAESIQANKTYMRTTENALQLTMLGDDWEETETKVLEFPNTKDKEPFFETQAVHPSGLGLWGADFDPECRQIPVEVKPCELLGSGL